MNTSKSIPASSAHRPVGEVWVWFTGMGLAVGLLMILGLLGLIFYQGISVFWPKSVAQLTLDEAGDFRFRGALETAGVLVFEKDIDVRDLTEAQRDSTDSGDRRERQYFVGNRDAYGESFMFVTVGDIAEVTYPKEIIRVERMEWGDALIYPIAIETADGDRVIGADESGFKRTLAAFVDEVIERRKRIEHIDRRQIGRINLVIRDLELEERFFLMKEHDDHLSPAEETRLGRIRESLSDLRAAYEPLAEEAGRLRREQVSHVLRYRVPNGVERTMPMGDFVHFYFPNDIGFFEKLGLFAWKMWDFLSGYPREANTEGGIFPAIFGTFVMTLIMSVAVMPFGVLAAIYLREYAKQGPMVRSVRIAINNLAGVPSIVFGIFGLGFFVYFVGGTLDQVFFPKALASNTPTFGTPGILWASLTLALMTVPVVIVSTEEALAAVSRGVREGSLACGASKWQTIQRLVLPAAAPGIMTGLVLAMARGAGEVAPLILTGVVALAPNLPLDATFPFIHLERKFMHLGFHIYDLGFQSPDSEAAKPMVFATTLVLILLVIVLNLAAIMIRNYLRRKYLASVF